MDISTLGIAVDSRPVDQATRSMDQMTSAAQRVEGATQRMGGEASRAARDVEKETRNMERAMRDAATQGVVIGQAISEGMRMAVRAVQALDAMITKVGDLRDLADMTGASASGLSQMRVAADNAGLSMDRVANLMVSMTRQLSAVSDESRNAGKALSVLGIDVDKFRQLKGDQQFSLLAERLNKISDSGGKTALILDIVGRGGAEAAKLLKALGDEANITAGYTDELIAAMDDYADANTRARSQMGLTLELLAVQMAPAFAAFRGALMDTILHLMGVGKESSNLGKNTGALEFARTVGLGLANIIDISAKAVLHLVAVGKVIGAVAAAAAALVSGQGREGVAAVMEGLKADIDVLREKMKFSTADSFEKRFNDIINGEKQITEVTDSELDKRVASYHRANEKISKADRDAQRAAAKALREAEAERKRLEREAEREREREDRERIKFNREWVTQQGEAVLAANREYQKQQEEFRKAQEEADRASLKSTVDSINAINDRTNEIEEEIRTRKMLRSEIEEEKLALLERDRVNFEGSERDLELLDLRIEAQRKLISAIQWQETIKAGEDAAKRMEKTFDKTWDHVGQSLSDEIMRGGFKARDYLERTFKTLILKPIIQASVMGLLGGVAGGAAGAGGSPLGQVAGSLLGGVGSLFGAGGIGGSLAAGAGWLTGATTFGGALGAGASLIGTGTLGGIASGLGMLAGALGPVALGIWGLSRLFGSKGGPKEGGTFGQTFNVTSASTRYDQQMAQTAQGLMQQYQQLASMLGATFTQGISFSGAFSADPRGTSPTFLELNALRDGQRIGSRVDWGVGRSDEELQRAIAGYSADVLLEALLASGIDGEIMAYFRQISQGLTGEGKLAALQQAAAMAQAARQQREYIRAIQDMSNVFAYTMNTMTNMRAASQSSMESLAQLVGGFDNLATGMNNLLSNFSTTIQRRVTTAERVATVMGRAGVSAFDNPNEVMRMTRENYITVMQAADLNTEVGRRLYAELLQLSGAFADISEAIREPDLWTVDEALGALNEAYNRQKDELTGLRDAMAQASQGYTDFIASLKTDQSLSPLTPGQRMTELQEQYQRAMIEADRDQNSPEAMSRLTAAARSLLEGGRSFYGSGEGYDQLYDQIMREMEGRADLTRNAVTSTELQLAKLDDQVRYLIDIKNVMMSVDEGIKILQRVKAGDLVVQGYPHASGLERVPFDNYPALLHRDETVLTPQQADFFRQAPNLVGELVALRAEVSTLRRENRQDAGNSISAMFDAMRQSAEVQTEAVLRTARTREYQSKTRPVLV